MRIPYFIFVLAALLVLTGCSSVPEKAPADDVSVDTGFSFENESPQEVFSDDILSNLTYTLVDTSVRSALTKASIGFQVDLSNGTYAFPSSMRAFGFGRVTADLSNVVRADVTRDDIEDAVIPLFIEYEDSSILELAVVSRTEKGIQQIASIPIGIAVLNSLQSTNGKIRVNFVHQVPGDPGPRNTELLFDLASEVATSTPSEL